MLIRALTCPLGDHADLIQRQPALPQALHATGKLLRAASDSGDRVRVRRRRTGLPRQQRRHRPRPGSTAQLIAIHLGSDLHNAPINRVALPSQLRQLLEQHREALLRAHRCGARGSSRRHAAIIAFRYDNFPLPDSPRGCGTAPRKSLSKTTFFVIAKHGSPHVCACGVTAPFFKSCAAGEVAAG